MKYQIQNSADQIDSLSQQEKEKMVQQKMEEMQQEAKDNPWLQYFLNYDPLKTARQVKNVPVLILQGTSDKQVPPADAEKLAKAFKQAGNKNVSLKMFEDYNHVFLHDPNGNPGNYQNLKSFKIDAEVMQPIVTWVKKVTKRDAK